MMLQAQGLTLMRGGRQVVADVSLQVAPGRLVGLLGANGAGKSTLLAALAGELSLRAGTVRCNGDVLAGLTPAAQARRRAVLPQQPGLSFDLGVDDVVAMGAYPFPELSPAAVRRASEAALALAGVAHLAGRRYLSLSGGEQQRVQFARVLLQCRAASGPRYLLLDEPTASLDPRHQLDLLAVARDLAHAGDTGVLVILHDLNLAARWCDELVLLAEGRVAAAGAPAAVLTAAHLRTAYGVQAEILPHPHAPERPLVLVH
ncbi:heme ABC transporter ATP-binding protein [Bordetella genomosp. 5]|uniref:Heme ABC transporter ATP-binding protein n=1 Tax=Bordetella genomosp. 5 TaxID=1395608 RepID=A0A261TEX2_9BORD|nr:heme ABC transporter ATP-binding protein [Bordetella genomosp. 5]OZI48169.1 heme ABC transporter ATP-binding protein [Bordetella genomosp. 5]